jgi:hypothetical protein
MLPILSSSLPSLLGAVRTGVSSISGPYPPSITPSIPVIIETVTVPGARPSLVCAFAATQLLADCSVLGTCRREPGFRRDQRIGAGLRQLVRHRPRTGKLGIPICCPLANSDWF